jgi:VWFA-related protein
MKLIAIASSFVLLTTLAQQPPAPQPPEPPKQPTFRSGVELLAVDVAVVDGDGRPVTGLGPADFEVEVGGRRRTVARAEFIDYTSSAAAAPELSDVTSNQSDTAASEPRTILLVVDDESFGPSDGKAVFMTLAETVDQLFPRDPLGFAVLSGRTKPVDFTTNRKPIADTLRQLVGARTRLMGGMTINVALVEALDIVRGDTTALANVVTRECTGQVGMDREMCQEDILNESRSMVNEAEHQAQNTLTALARLFQAMAPLPGSKYLLLVSQGIATGRNPEMGTQIARAAASAGVTLHAFFVDRSGFGDISRSRESPRAFEDQRLLSAGLEMAVGAARGALHRLVGDPTNAFERVRRELSGGYRLGIELETADADGQPRNISVKVSRPGVTVRSHRQVIAPLSTANLTPEQRLTRSLQSPLVEREIGVRLGIFTYREENNAGRILISAEADAVAEDLRVGYVVRDSRGKAITAGDLGPDAIIGERDAPTLILFNTVVPPGDHTVKLALVDAEGRSGSAIRAVSVPAVAPKPFALGDLIVLPGGTETNRTRPTARIPQGSRQASVYFEAYAAPPSQKGAVLLEIADAPESPALVASRGTVDFKARGTTLRAAGTIRFSPAALPPGRYFARLKIEGSDVTAVRGFSVVSGAGAAALLPDESRALVPLFSVNRFLSEPLMRAVAARIEQEADANTGAATVARALTDGTWRELAPATGNVIADATLLGLQRLSAGEAADAERAFRDALDADPEFTLALALAGGAWAAVGRDREASRSWRTSLATGIDAPFLHEHVTEALLRSGDVKGTREFLSELEDSGADTGTLARARALSAAIAGERRQAVAALTPWVDAHSDDHEARFLLVLALYELKTIEKDAGANATFEARAKDYVERGGPRRALVARWLRSGPRS